MESPPYGSPSSRASPLAENGGLSPSIIFGKTSLASCWSGTVGPGPMPILETQKDNTTILRGRSLESTTSDLKSPIIRYRSGLDMKEELTCPICLEAYRLPVTVPCGHTFCRYCISEGSLCNKGCPLCRVPIGRTMSINMVLHNLIKAVGLDRKHRPRASNADRASETGMVTKLWWIEKVGKVKAAVPLQIFLKAMITDLKRSSDGLFFDDLVACVTDLMDQYNLWTSTKHIISLESATIFSDAANLIGIENDEHRDTNQEKIRSWLEAYVSQKPGTIASNNSSEPPLPNLAFHIWADKFHRVDSNVVLSQTIDIKLPWTGGRHALSVLSLPHSSVSLFHFLMVPLTNHKPPIGILDCGSSVGTMVKLKPFTKLVDADIIHIADYLELEIRFLTWQETIDRYSTAHTNSEELFSAENAVRVWDVAEKRVGKLPFDAVFDLVGDEVSCRLDVNHFAPLPLIEIGLLRSAFDNIKKNSSDEPMASSRGGVGQNSQSMATWLVDPLGVAIGRGPTFTSPVAKKITITDNNGYVSREHCLLYFGSFDSSAEPAWILRDVSSMGTYRKIKPFKEIVPLDISAVVKVGQCKIEIQERKADLAAQSSAAAPPAANWDYRPALTNRASFSQQQITQLGQLAVTNPVVLAAHSRHTHSGNVYTMSMGSPTFHGGLRQLQSSQATCPSRRGPNFDPTSVLGSPVRRSLVQTTGSRVLVPSQQQRSRQSLPAPITGSENSGGGCDERPRLFDNIQRPSFTPADDSMLLRPRARATTNERTLIWHPPDGASIRPPNFGDLFNRGRPVQWTPQQPLATTHLTTSHLVCSHIPHVTSHQEVRYFSTGAAGNQVNLVANHQEPSSITSRRSTSPVTSRVSGHTGDNRNGNCVH